MTNVLLQTSIPVDGDLVNFRARVSDLLGEIKDVSGPENVLQQVSVVAHKLGIAEFAGLENGGL